MSAQIRRARPEDLAPLVALDFRNFGGTVGPGEVAIAEKLLDLDRFLVAEDRGAIVAAGGSFAMELTGPGSTTLPMSGVTWVSVLASHRRRGLLRGMMAGLDELAAEFDEPILGLTASEGPIYERFGYGVATRNRVVELDRRRAQIDPRFDPDPVDLVFAADHIETMLACYERYRLTQPGEVSRSEALFRDQVLQRNKPDFAAIHPDGYAVWEVEPVWNNGHPAHVLTVKDLVAVTGRAHLALWNILLSVDLVGPIRTIRTVAHDDPLPYLLTDQRALRTVEANDYLWLKVADAVRTFASRRYGTDDRLVIGITEEHLAPDVDTPLESVDVAERIAVAGDHCRETDEAVELLATRSALGPLYLGVSASQLARGRRVRASTEVLLRADAMLGTGLLAHCRTAF